MEPWANHVSPDGQLRRLLARSLNRAGVADASGRPAAALPCGSQKAHSLQTSEHASLHQNAKTTQLHWIRRCSKRRCIRDSIPSQVADGGVPGQMLTICRNESMISIIIIIVYGRLPGPGTFHTSVSARRVQFAVVLCRAIDRERAGWSYLLVVSRSNCMCCARLRMDAVSSAWLRLWRHLT